MSDTPHQTMIAAFRCNDAAALIDWLCDTLDFERNLVVPGEGGRVEHAQLTWRGSMVMLGSAGDGTGYLDMTVGHASISLTAESNEQVDALYRRTQDADATIVAPMEDTNYGSHAFSVADPEGNLWHFGTYDPFAPTE